jgi:hypothetical protein
VLDLHGEAAQRLAQTDLRSHEQIPAILALPLASDLELLGGLAASRCTILTTILTTIFTTILTTIFTTAFFTFVRRIPNLTTAAQCWPYHGIKSHP